MGPDRSGQEEIELYAEDGRIEVGIEIEMGQLQLDLFGRKEILEAIFDSPASRLDAVVAAGIEKSDEPVGDPETPAADFENLGFGSQSLIEQGDQLFAARLLERRNRYTQEAVPGHHFLSALL